MPVTRLGDTDPNGLHRKGCTVVRVLLWIAAVAGAVTLAVTIPNLLGIPNAYVFAPLLGLAILWIGLGSLRSLQAGAAHVPSGPPESVDPTVERTTYRCAGCGAEVLLLVRGTDMPPRHCGERMHERVEVLRDGPQRGA